MSKKKEDNSLYYVDGSWIKFSKDWSLPDGDYIDKHNYRWVVYKNVPRFVHNNFNVKHDWDNVKLFGLRAV